jgi:formylmethanofuran dehydrogenase subunit E
VTEETRQLEMQIKDAVELHGHLGPFLVIGVRMGKVAEQLLDSEHQQNGELHASVEVPLRTPFSCTLDGIQSITHCTIGNQRLRVKRSRKKITARFEITDSDKILTMTVNPKIVKDVMHEISKGTSSEALADVIVSTPERQLFKSNVIKKQR